MDVELLLADDAATADFARRLAAALRPGDMLLLFGDLGAGKTTLARTIIRTLIGDERMDVPSPSFALVQPYEGNGWSILHADLYRIQDPREVDELGLFDRPDAVVLCEWPEQGDHEFVDSATGEVIIEVPADHIGRIAKAHFADRRKF